MTFENEFAKLNEHFFFSEFTFSKNTFKPSLDNQFELADSILWLDDIFVVYQLKERNIGQTTSIGNEKKWFYSKVIGNGTKQIRDTLKYLASNNEIEIENHRGHKFLLDTSSIRNIHKVVCYFPEKSLPMDCVSKKYHQSRTAGIIHLLSAVDYLGVITTLLTPSEFSEYLGFREELISKWGRKLDSVTEQALVTCPLKTVPVTKLENNLNWTYKEVIHAKKTLPTRRDHQTPEIS